MKEPSPPMYVDTAGLAGTLLLWLCLNEGGVFPEELSDDPDAITCAILALHSQGYELEMLLCGRLCIARDAELPIPGPWRSYFNYVRSVVLDDPCFIRSVLREDLRSRLARFIRLADRKIDATLEPALTPGRNTLPALVVIGDNGDDASGFDPNSVIAELG